MWGWDLPSPRRSHVQTFSIKINTKIAIVAYATRPNWNDFGKTILRISVLLFFILRIIREWGTQSPTFTPWREQSFLQHKQISSWRLCVHVNPILTNEEGNSLTWISPLTHSVTQSVSESDSLEHWLLTTHTALIMPTFERQPRLHRSRFISAMTQNLSFFWCLTHFSHTTSLFHRNYHKCFTSTKIKVDLIRLPDSVIFKLLNIFHFIGLRLKVL